MYRRLAIVSQKLGYYGVRHRLITEEMLERMSGDPDPVALRVLADVVQPPKGYDRQQLRNFGDFTPLNRLDDAVLPESETARVFDAIARRIADGKGLTLKTGSRRNGGSRSGAITMPGCNRCWRDQSSPKTWRRFRATCPRSPSSASRLWMI